jgi:hypothetical protein
LTKADQAIDRLEVDAIAVGSDTANPMKRQRVSNDVVPSSTEPES